MSAEFEKEPKEAYPGQYAELMEVYRLAEELEQLAQQYSEDYAEGISDGCTARQGDIELGGELITSVEFKAERTREEITKGVFGKVITAEYEFVSSIKHRGLSFDSFPEHVKNCITEMDDFDEEYLRDSTTEFAIEFALTHTLSTEGEFMHEQALLIYIDDTAIRFPDAIIVSENDDEESDDEPYNDDGEQENTMLDTVIDSELANVFDFEELLAFTALTKQVVSQHNRTNILDDFYQQIDAMRYLPRKARLAMVQQMAKDLFLDEAA